MRVSQLGDPAAVGMLPRAVRVGGREVELGGRAVAGPRIERGRERGRGADDEDVTAFEEPWELGEDTVLDPLSRPVSDEQADIVASEAPLFGWPRGLTGGGQVELDQLVARIARATLDAQGVLRERAHRRARSTRSPVM